MRARSALTLALVLALPLVLRAAPARDDALEGHAVGAALSAQLESVLGAVAGEPARGLGPGVLPTSPLVQHPGGAPSVEVHLLAGERTWSQWVPLAGASDVDLDRDGAPDLQLRVDQVANPALTVAGLAPARVAWAAWVEQGGAKWGLSGAGLAPEATLVALRDGDLRVAASSGVGAWHAAFAYAGEHRRTLAWLAEPGTAGFEAALGGGFQARLPDGAASGLRMLLVDGARSHDLTLRGLPKGAQLVLGDLGLAYRAARAGGALAYLGDASLLGQRGDVALAAEPLPPSLTIAPEGPGFALEAEPATDAVVDWRPPGGEGVRFVANDVERVAVQPGAAGGIVLQGTRGHVAVERPADALAGQVVDLGAQGSVAVAAPSPIVPAAVALTLGGILLWALRAPKKAVEAA